MERRRGTKTVPIYEKRRLHPVTQKFDDFIAQVSASATLRERYDQKIIEVQALAKNEGVEVASDDVIAMPSFRMAVYADSNDHVESFEEEGVLIPSIKQARRLKEMREAAPGSADRQALDELSQAMTPLERMRFARKHGFNKPPVEKKKEYTKAEMQEIVRQNDILSGAAKIAHARKHGLI